MATLKSTTINGSLSVNGDFNIETSANNSTFQVIRNKSISASTAGYWAAMLNSTQDGSPTLPTSLAWWHVISMDWINTTSYSWISQVAFPTKDANGKPPYYRHNTGDSDEINSTTWHAFITDENISSQSVYYATSSGSAGSLIGTKFKIISGYDKAYSSNYNFTDIGNTSSSTYRTGVMIAQAINETSGIFLGGDYINMWSPCDSYSIRYYDEDTGLEVWNINSSGLFSGTAASANSADSLKTFTGNATISENVKGNIVMPYSTSNTWGAVFQWCSNSTRLPTDSDEDNWYFQLRGLTDGSLAFRYKVNGGIWNSYDKLIKSSQFSYSNGVLSINNY